MLEAHKAEHAELPVFDMPAAPFGETAGSFSTSEHAVSSSHAAPSVESHVVPVQPSSHAIPTAGGHYVTVPTGHGASANGYGGNSALSALGGGRKPSVAGLIPERAIYDFLLTFAYDKMFERFPNLRICSVENGSGFPRDLFVKLEQSKERMPWYYKEDPAELFRRHVWINPFWEDRIPDVIEHMGAGQVIYGSDWPHMEGMEQPRDILEELGDVSPGDRAKVLYENTAALNERRPV